MLVTLKNRNKCKNLELQMKSKFFNSKKVFLSAFLLGTSFLFAQENIRQEDFSAEDSSEKNFVIIESKHSYNLNPRTANYSAEAQILTGDRKSVV